MQENYSNYSVPSFAQVEDCNFDEANSFDREVFLELNAIAEEIEKCRLRNC